VRSQIYKHGHRGASTRPNTAAGKKKFSVCTPRTGAWKTVGQEWGGKSMGGVTGAEA